jgi:hypothetical protein
MFSFGLEEWQEDSAVSKELQVARCLGVELDATPWTRERLSDNR